MLCEVALRAGVSRGDRVGELALQAGFAPPLAVGFSPSPCGIFLCRIFLRIDLRGVKFAAQNVAGYPPLIEASTMSETKSNEAMRDETETAS
jgi:hypothetical protein